MEISLNVELTEDEQKVLRDLPRVWVLPQTCKRLERRGFLQITDFGDDFNLTEIGEQAKAILSKKAEGTGNE